MRFGFSKAISDPTPRADRCCRTGLWGSVITALCCLTPLIVFLLGGVGLAFLTPYLDYFLVPLFGVFLLLGLYGWMHGGKITKRKSPGQDS